MFCDSFVSQKDFIIRSYRSMSGDKKRSPSGSSCWCSIGSIVVKVTILKRRLEPLLVETYLNIQRQQQAIPFATIFLCEKMHSCTHERKLSISLWSEKLRCPSFAWEANIPLSTVLSGCWRHVFLTLCFQSYSTQKMSICFDGYSVVP